jgi:hypothetical protein
MTKLLFLESEPLRLETREVRVEPEPLSWEAAARSRPPSSPLPP